MKQTVFRDPNSFENRTVFELSTGEMLELTKDGLVPLEPEVVDVDYFKSKIEALGEVTRFENFISSSTLMEVVRGSVIHNGIEKFFFLDFKKLYKSSVDNLVSTLEYTKEV